MFYLGLAILTSSMNGILFRLSEDHVKNRFSMLAFNYLLCLVLALVYSAGSLPQDLWGSASTWGLGLVNGILFLGGFVMMQYCTREHGVVLTSVFSRLGVLVPTLLAVTVFKEKMSLIQFAGISLAVCAILLMNWKKGIGLKGMAPALILLLLVAGCCDGMAKIYEQWGQADLSQYYLVISFLVALVLNVVLVIIKKEKIDRYDVLFGLLIGIPNYFVARFLLKAVGLIPAVIVYPCFSVGTILVCTLAGVLLFHEKIEKKQAVAIGVILLSMVLLNI